MQRSLMLQRVPIGAPSIGRGRAVAAQPRVTRGLLLCRDSASGFLADLPRSSSSVLMSWDESAAEEPHEEVSWNNWLATELGEKLVGVQAKTSRAWVETSGLRSANMVKGRIRANKIDLELELQGRHLKQEGSLMRGSIRVVLKTEDSKDQICLSPIIWDQPVHASEQVLADIEAAAECPLKSALSIRLNDILWDVEKRSLDSMDSSH